MEDSKSDVIEYYFNLKYSNEIILVFLERFHGIKLSLRTLKRRLRLFGLRRRGNVIDEGTIRQAITTEISGPAQLQGYRSMYQSTNSVKVPTACAKKYSRTTSSRDRPFCIYAKEATKINQEIVFCVRPKFLLARGR